MSRETMIIKKLDRKTAMRIMRAGGLATQLPVSMALCVILGAIIGLYIDKFFDTKPWFSLLFTVFGIAAAIKSAIRIIRELQKLTDEEDKE